MQMVEDATQMPGPAFWQIGSDGGYLDANGWVREIPAGLQSVGSYWASQTESLDRRGTFVMTYDGEGTIQLGGNITIISQTPGRIVFSNPTGGDFLFYEEGVTEVEIDNPGSRHSLAVGLLTRCKIAINGSLGYFGCGLIDRMWLRAAPGTALASISSTIPKSAQ